MSAIFLALNDQIFKVLKSSFQNSSSYSEQIKKKLIPKQISNTNSSNASTSKMCNDNWTVSPDKQINIDENNLAIEVSSPILFAPIPVVAARVVNNSVPEEGFQRLFFARDFARLPMPQYVIRMQRFDFRRESVRFMNTLFNQWLLRQQSYNPLLHVTSACDECGTHVNDLELVAHAQALMIPGYFEAPHYLKLISCSHTICSACLVTKRFIFVNLGLPICCNSCGVCWLQF